MTGCAQCHRQPSVNAGTVLHRGHLPEPVCQLLAGLVEVDETTVPPRTKAPPPVAKPGRADKGEPLFAGAVEIQGRGLGRARVAVIADCATATLGGSVAANVVAGSTVVGDGWSGYAKLKDVKQDPRIVGPMAAHAVLPWMHRLYANVERSALRVYHGLRELHRQCHPDAFVFRFNRRRTPRAPSPSFSASLSSATAPPARC